MYCFGGIISNGSILLSVDQRFISLVRSNGQFTDWPLETIVPDRGIFIAFLQERWDRLIRMKAGQIAGSRAIKVAGPAELPFEHPDIKSIHRQPLS